VQPPQSVRIPDGRTLTWREGGDPTGVPVFELHGTPGSSLLYEPHLRDAGERGIRLLSYDRPGYGASTRRAGRNVADCAADLAALCDALGIERFCVWGISGGAPHALAVAALLPDRVAAAAALAAPAPFDAEGLDFFAGMGEQNVESIQAVLAGEEDHRAAHERDLAQLLAVTPDELESAWRTLLGPADVEVLTTAVAAFVLDEIRAGLQPSAEGWFDDDLALVEPWGFDLGAIRVPVLYWHGEQDRFVPFAHGVWLAERIPGVDARLTADDGHLTLYERRIPEVHAWLLERSGLRS
jgi:pimeloyl-ACP methyl ester carboxylesterase